MDIKITIDQISREKGIKRELVEAALLTAVAKVAGKKLPYAKLEALFNQEGAIEVYNFKKVVDSEPEMLDEETEINLPQARELDANAQIDDELGILLDFSFGRIDASLIEQTMHDAIERAAHEEAFKHLSTLKGKLVQGKVISTDLKGVLVSLGSIDGYMPKTEQVFSEKLKRDQTLDFLLKDIYLSKSGRCKTVLSRKDPQLVVELFKDEVMEVKDGTITIVKAVREPGTRTKLLVDTQERLNPVATCIGAQGYRIEKVQSRLSGERIDVVQYTRNEQNLLTNLFGKVRLSNVVFDDATKKVTVEVSKEDMPKALGLRGVNVRLASQLLGKELVIKEKTSNAAAPATPVNSAVETK